MSKCRNEAWGMATQSPLSMPMLKLHFVDPSLCLCSYFGSNSIFFINESMEKNEQANNKESNS